MLGYYSNPRTHAQRRAIVVGLSVSRSVGLTARFLSNRGCSRYQTWICGYVQRALGTARVWSGVVEEQHVLIRRGPKIMCSYILYWVCINKRSQTDWDTLAPPAETEVTCIWKVSILGTFRS